MLKITRKFKSKFSPVKLIVTIIIITSFVISLISCSKCDHVYASITDNGYTIHKCINCSDVYRTVTIEMENLADIGYTDNTLNLTIPSTVVKNGVTYDVVEIGNWAFYDLSLKSVTIPASVENISSDAFQGCAFLLDIIVDVDNPNYCDVDGVLFSEDKTCLIKYPTGKTDNVYTIPDSVTSIGRYAFSDCTKFKSMSIPDGVTTIDRSAFRDCTSLENITIPSSIKYISNGAFYGCAVLTDVTFNGTKSQWNDLSFDDAFIRNGNWNTDTDCYIVHCTDGNIAKS